MKGGKGKGEVNVYIREACLCIVGEKRQGPARVRKWRGFTDSLSTPRRITDSFSTPRGFTGEIVDLDLFSNTDLFLTIGYY